MRAWGTVAVLLVVAGLASGLAWVTFPRSADPPAQGAPKLGDPGRPWRVDAVAYDPTVVVGDSLVLTLRVTNVASPGTAFVLAIDGPDLVDLVDREWRGNLTPGNSTDLSLPMQAVRAGCGQIFVTAKLFGTRVPLCVVEAPSPVWDALDFWTSFPSSQVDASTSSGHSIEFNFEFARHASEGVKVELILSDGLENRIAAGATNSTGSLTFEFGPGTASAKSPHLEFLARDKGMQRIVFVISTRSASAEAFQEFSVA